MSIIKEALDKTFGFITEDMLSRVVDENRLYPCLVRCGGGRFVCPAQDVKHFIDIITRDGIDYVRDISLKGD